MSDWYNKQLACQKWKEKSFEIKIKAKLTCELCGYESPNLQRLVVHHREYIKGLRPWEYEDEYLMCLCKECHRKVHHILIERRRIESTLLGVLARKRVAELKRMYLK